MNRSVPVLLVLLVLALGLGVACGPTTAVDAGAAIFHDARLSRSEFNTFSCATCHDVGEDGSDGGRIKAGHSLQNSVFRSTWWGGTTPTLKDAVDQCLRLYMREQPLDVGSDQSRALYEYLLSISDERPSADLPLTIVENVSSLPRGNPVDGARVYDAACLDCHGAAFTGEGRPSELIAIVPNDSVDFAQESGFPLDAVIIEKVRHGPFFGIGGTMPPFATERLSDEDLGALVAFLVEE